MTEAQPDLQPTEETSAAGGVAVPYDFRTGSELSREALSQVQGQIDRLTVTLGRIMNVYLNCPTDFEVLSAEAMTFDVYLEQLGPAPLLGIVELQGHLSAMWWQMDGIAGGAALGRMLGGQPLELDRRATELELAVLRRFLREIVDVWASTSDKLMHWRPELIEVITDGIALQTAMRATEIVRVVISATIAGAQGQICLCLPVETVRSLVAEGSGATIDEPLDTSDASRTTAQIAVQVAAIVHRGVISFGDAMALSEGDVVPLGKPLDDPLIISVRGQDKFVAQAGVRSGRLSARILGPIGNGN